MIGLLGPGKCFCWFGWEAGNSICEDRYSYFRAEIFLFAGEDMGNLAEPRWLRMRRRKQIASDPLKSPASRSTECWTLCNKYCCMVLHSWPIKVWQSHQLPEKMHVIQLHAFPSSDERHYSGPSRQEYGILVFWIYNSASDDISKNTLAVLVVVTKCLWITLIRVSDTCQILMLLESPKYLGTNISRYFIYFNCLKYHFIWEQIFPKKIDNCSWCFN